MGSDFTGFIMRILEWGDEDYMLALPFNLCLFLQETLVRP